MAFPEILSRRAWTRQSADGKASGEKGIQSFDQSLVELYKSGRIGMDDALANADSRTNLEARINFG